MNKRLRGIMFGLFVLIVGCFGMYAGAADDDKGDIITDSWESAVDGEMGQYFTYHHTKWYYLNYPDISIEEVMIIPNQSGITRPNGTLDYYVVNGDECETYGMIEWEHPFNNHTWEYSFYLINYASGEIIDPWEMANSHEQVEEETQEVPQIEKIETEDDTVLVNVVEETDAKASDDFSNEDSEAELPSDERNNEHAEYNAAGILRDDDNLEEEIEKINEGNDERKKENSIHSKFIKVLRVVILSGIAFGIAVAVNGLEKRRRRHLSRDVSNMQTGTPVERRESETNGNNNGYDYF